jgi:galactonate dehydratase
MALWDLAGKAMGLPVYRLMGGRVRDKVAVYFHSHEPKDAVDYVKRTGVKAIKTQIGMVAMADNNEFGWDPGKVANMTLTNRQIEDIGKHVASMREALGPDFGIALECHTQFDTESALQVCKVVEPHRPLWVEEPVPSDNVEAMAFIRAHSRVPIACGENVYTRFGARPYFEKQAISMFQLDMAKCGGLLESRKMAALAEVYHIPIAPHGVATKLGIAAYAHVCSTVPNFMVLEWLHHRDDVYNKLTTSPEYADGFLKVPETPGIGVEVNEDAVKEVLMPGYPML